MKRVLVVFIWAFILTGCGGQTFINTTTGTECDPYNPKQAASCVAVVGEDAYGYPVVGSHSDTWWGRIFGPSREEQKIAEAQARVAIAQAQSRAIQEAARAKSAAEQARAAAIVEQAHAAAEVRIFEIETYPTRIAAYTDSQLALRAQDHTNAVEDRLLDIEVMRATTLTFGPWIALFLIIVILVAWRRYSRL